MTATNAHIRPSALTELVAELERHGAGRPTEIARRLGPGWTEATVVVALVQLFCDGGVGHNHDIGLWWVA